MKSQVEVSELMERIHHESRRHRGLPSSPWQESAPTNSAVPPPPSFDALAGGGTLPSGLLVQTGNMLERARRKVTVAPGVPKFLRPFYRNQGGYNDILLEALECLREANRQLLVDNDALRSHVEKQNRWMEAAAHGFGVVEGRLMELERQNDRDQQRSANFRAHVKGQPAQAD